MRRVQTAESKCLTVTHDKFQLVSKDELSLFSSLSLSVDNTIRINMLIYKGRKQHKNGEESLCSLVCAKLCRARFPKAVKLLSFFFSP